MRNCLVALASRKELAEVFNYRFEGGGGLSDHRAHRKHQLEEQMKKAGL